MRRPGRLDGTDRGERVQTFEMMCRYANNRCVGDGPISEKQLVHEWVAGSRVEIDQARLLTLYAAWKMDTAGRKAARQPISAAKLVVPQMMMNVLDRAIQCHGALGMTDETPLALMWRHGRALRIADAHNERLEPAARLTAEWG